jgi:hypothetical protein
MPILDRKLEISWNGVDWKDVNGQPNGEEDYLLSASGSFRFFSPTSFFLSGAGTVDSAIISLANVAGRYNSIINDASFLQRHVRLSVDIGAGFERIFSGAIEAASLSATTSTEVGILTLRCVTQEGPYLQRKISTAMSDFETFCGSPVSETDWMNYLLDKLGSPLTRSFDRGIMILPWLWTDDESVLDECWAVAAACGGVFYTNRLGHVVYENASNLAKNIDTISETFTRSTNGFSDAQLSVDQDNLYSDITVAVNFRHVASPQIVWSPDEAEDLVIPPSSVPRTIEVTFDDPVVRLDGNVEFEAVSAGGEPMTFYFVNVAVTKYAQRMQLKFTNTHPHDCAYIKYITVRGFPVIGSPAFEHTESVPAGDTFWDNKDRRTRSVRDTLYVQTMQQAYFLSSLMLADSSSPRRVISINDIPGKPTRFIGDIVTVRDSTILTTDIVGRIEEMSWRLDLIYAQSVVVRDFGEMYSAAPYFIVGTHTIGGPRKLFY